jgi:peptidase E
MKEKFSHSNVIYLPGGDPKIFLKKLKNKKAHLLLKKFDGFIIGVSAGAYVLSKEYIEIINENKLLATKMLGLISIHIKAHYEKKMDPGLLNISLLKKIDIFAIPNNAAVILYKNKIRKIIGTIYLFSNGEKIELKLNK